MKKTLLTCMLITSITASAENDTKNNLNYNYLEIGYGYDDIAGFIDSDGFRLNGSIDLSDRFYLNAYLNRNSSKITINSISPEGTNSFETIDYNFSEYGMAFGLKKNLTDRTDLNIEAEYGIEDLPFGTNNLYSLGIGTRTAINEKFEIDTLLKHTESDMKFSKSKATAELKGVYKFNQSSAISTTIKVGERSNNGFELFYRHSF